MFAINKPLRRRNFICNTIPGDEEGTVRDDDIFGKRVKSRSKQVILSGTRYTAPLTINQKFPYIIVFLTFIKKNGE